METMVSQVAALPMGGRAAVGMAPNERAAIKSARKPTMNQGTSLPTFSFGFGRALPRPGSGGR